MNKQRNLGKIYEIGKNFGQNLGDNDWPQVKIYKFI